ncbi:hypothetical protein E1B28_004831 [Marasmius oreades]|uniref:Fe2OG dioxygenase domain-containing protein n=1 Tax=Marasmius oreades TaxID=181124 RepID=A0A9P7UZH7_9AGAR|nr:uncharacterized protein E1B28_004831 [Marasmius oreades]KAG7097489.1 hypothetical protein E1B28_004831 [Marasmius oreades]
MTCRAPSNLLDDTLESDSLKRKRSDLEFQSTDSSSKRLALRITIPAERAEQDEASPSSLFSAGTSSPLAFIGSPEGRRGLGKRFTPAQLLPPPIPGLFFDPSILLPGEVADTVFRYCLATYFTSPEVNQIMLFGRAPSSSTQLSPGSKEHVELLRPLLPPNVHSLLFPSIPRRARQAIINLYNPGEGITAHVDLLRRFGDGIVGVSLSSGCVMQFVRQRGSSVDNEAEGRCSDEMLLEHDLYIPERSILVMTEDARYKWTHGIPHRSQDYVESETGGVWINRKVRLSITFRWLLPGAEIVGDEEGM